MGERKKASEKSGSWGRERGKKGGTLSVVGGERKKRASEEKKGGLRARKKSGRGGTVSVVGGERKKRASEEKKGGDCLGSWERAKKSGRARKTKGGLSR